MATNRSGSFPLNFDAASWSIEDALPCIFFGDFQEPEMQLYSLSAVAFIVNETEKTIFKTQYPALNQLIDDLHRKLTVLRLRGKIANRSECYAPLLWCQLAVQFWLKYGLRQKTFTDALLSWIKGKNKKGAQLVFYESNLNGNHKTKITPLSIFLLEEKSGIDIVNPRLKPTRQNIPKNSSQNIITPNTKASISIGKNALNLVLSLVEKTAKDGSIRNLKRNIDPATNHYRFIGSRPDLYTELLGLYPDKIGKYSKTVIIKAISQAAICRKSFPS